ncbi:Uncharacterised protein [Mycobacteroides abscessus subsp. abscessus]|nr:Uncharacterised protein [Mycobacteroides abscessus subsp. abscessus]
MTHCAVGAEEAAAGSGVALLGIEVLCLRDRRSRSQRTDIGRELSGLLIVELGFLDTGLRAVGLQGHASGADLEVDCCRTDADEAGSGLGALGVEAVARRAVRGEELLALFDVGCAGRRGGIRARGLGEECVRSAGQQQAHEEQHDECHRVPAAIC